MKSIEVFANFGKGKISIEKIAIGREVYNWITLEKLSARRYKNKSLKYFRINSDGKKEFIIAFNPVTMNWVFIENCITNLVPNKSKHAKRNK